MAEERGREKEEEREKETGAHLLEGNVANVYRPLLVVAAEDVSFQDPKGRPVRMPEY